MLLVGLLVALPLLALRFALRGLHADRQALLLVPPILAQRTALRFAFYLLLEHAARIVILLLLRGGVRLGGISGTLESRFFDFKLVAFRRGDPRGCRNLPWWPLLGRLISLAYRDALFLLFGVSQPLLTFGLAPGSKKTLLEVGKCEKRGKERDRELVSRETVPLSFTACGSRLRLTYD